MLRLKIGGAAFRLETAAVSAVRYRAEYGGSVLNHLASCRTAGEREGRLLRLCRMMIPPAERPGLREFARLARRDPAFLRKALRARDALLAPDPGHPLPAEEAGAEPFDEYRILAMAAAAGLDLALMYEAPILHLMAVAEECFRLRNPDGTDYRPMTAQEMGELYRR